MNRHSITNEIDGKVPFNPLLHDRSEQEEKKPEKIESHNSACQCAQEQGTGIQRPSEPGGDGEHRERDLVNPAAINVVHGLSRYMRSTASNRSPEPTTPIIDPPRRSNIRAPMTYPTIAPATDPAMQTVAKRKEATVAGRWQGRQTAHREESEGATPQSSRSGTAREERAGGARKTRSAL